MYAKYLPFSLLICLTIWSPAAALTASPQTQSASAPTTTSDEQKVAEAQKALRLQAIGLLRQILADSSNLTLAENRIRVQVVGAQALWQSDEKEARRLLSAAAATLAQLMNSTGTQPADEMQANLDTSLLTDLRSQMITVAGLFDPGFALELLQQTKPGTTPADSPTGPFNGKLPGDADTSTELSLANQIAAKDPEKAFQIADQLLKSKAVTPELLNIVSSLYQAKDPQYAVKLASEINSALLDADFSSYELNPETAFGLLSQATQPQADGGASTGSADGQAPPPKPPLLQKDEITQLIEKVVSFALNTLGSMPQGSAEWNGAHQTLKQLLASVPNLQQYDPQAAASVSQKLAALPDPDAQNGQVWADLNKLSQTGTPQELITAARNAPPSIRPNYYQQAMWKAVSQGDFDQARQIVSQHLPGQYQRDQLLTMIDQNAAQQAVGNGKVDQALDLISQMPRPQQCELLIQLAESSGVQQADKKVGLNILDRARSTLPPQPQNYLQLQSLMKLAGAYSKFDAKRGLALISDAMGRINSLAAAAQVMEGFDVQGNFKEGELVITPRAQLTTALQALGGQLAALAASDFKGAINACSLLDRADSRAMVELEMVQQILGDQGSQEGALRAPQGANMTMTVDNF